jgi:antitoxin component of MazEF toxin-antitoxin module
MNHMYGRRITFRRVGGNISVTIPAELCNHIGLKAGTPADLRYQNQKITLDLTTSEQTRLFDPPTRAPEPVIAAE